MKILTESESPLTDEGFEKLLEYINNGDYTEIVYDNSREHETGLVSGPPFFEILYPALQNTGTKFTFIVNGERDYNWLDEYPLVRRIGTPFHFFRHVHNDYKIRLGYDVTEYSVDNFETPFVCLNGKPHPYRCMLMDKLQGSSAINNCKYTWVFTQEDMNWGGYRFKNWKEQRVHLEPNIEPGSIVDEMHLDVELKPFAQLISESQIDYFFITEKTVKAIFLKQPFLVFGNPGFHSKLKQWGFKLYTELFDYGFDIISNPELRAELIVKEFEKLSSIDIHEMYKVLEPKLIHNMNRGIELMNSYEHNKEIIDYMRERREYFREPLELGQIHSRYLKHLIL